MTERWHTDRVHETAEDSVRLQPQYIEIEDTGAADTSLRILHNLGRVPRGVRIVNKVCSSALGWYRPSTDDDWNEREIFLRFNLANARVLLEVF